MSSCVFDRTCHFVAIRQADGCVAGRPAMQTTFSRLRVSSSVLHKSYSFLPFFPVGYACLEAGGVGGPFMKWLVFALALSASVVGSAAQAADIPAPALVPPPIYVSSPLVSNWTGFYIGGNLGIGWNSGGFADPFGNTFSPNTGTDFLGGGQVGLNYQFNNGVLVGAEADFDWLANSTNSTNTITLMGPSGASTGGNPPLSSRSIIAR